MITKNQAGEFIGYTITNLNKKPTLYFEKGRLTLQHDHHLNVGWHSNQGIQFKRQNIDQNSAEVYQGLIEKYNFAKINNIVILRDELWIEIQKFALNFMNNKIINCKKKNAQLFECIEYDNIGFITHLSRSKLIKTNQENFEKIFSIHIEEILAQSKLAKNEH
ncbi:hypothetical protein [uncultured Aquimarina sp.]|uniref:hypothetical protein n=1 Tax=uncultured Aquimarina sp. TaxID=575652 RepID=UPI00260A670E|nr:hypothetical protein [uncultured Aquimarina sp.]